jgi:N,N-dimethylformamidase beta subunit-like protein
MATKRTTSTLAGIAVAVVLFGFSWPATGDQPAPAAQLQHESDEYEEDEYEEDGYAAAKARHQEPDAIEAAFPLESYRPRATAVLRIWTPTRDASVRIFHVGPEPQLTIGDKLMEGVPVTAPRRFAALRSGQRIRIAVGNWPSGLYFAKVTSPGQLGFAPFIVAPKRLGEHLVAVVLPTRTWQAYNFRDDGGDGKGDTWYATKGHLQSRLGRPFLNRGVPPHYRNYDLRFLRWLHESGRKVDVLSQAELDGTTGARLAQAYDLIVFPGHHEYVTKREYDAVEGFRNRGGNLMFLSANNFFWRIDLHGRTMTRVAQWRDLGRPEASLLGVQYMGNDRGEHRGPWLVRPAAASGWIFAGIKLRDGNAFSDAGVEIDAMAPSSPRGTHILAEIPNLLGPGLTAHMTYYETPAGAKVFAAGAFTLAGSVRQPAVVRLLANLWARMADETR